MLRHSLSPVYVVLKGVFRVSGVADESVCAFGRGKLWFGQCPGSLHLFLLCFLSYQVCVSLVRPGNRHSPAVLSASGEQRQEPELAGTPPVSSLPFLYFSLGLPSRTPCTPNSLPLTLPLCPLPFLSPRPPHRDLSLAGETGASRGPVPAPSPLALLLGPPAPGVALAVAPVPWTITSVLHTRPAF